MKPTRDTKPESDPTRQDVSNSEAFADLVCDVERLPPSRRVVPPQTDGPVPRLRTSSMATSLSVDYVDGFIRASAPGVSRAVVDDLMAGRFPPQREIDLHRLSSAAAREVLLRALAQARRDGLLSLLVICGRGRHSGVLGPVLPEVACDVLSQAGRDVVAFCSAPPRLGGEGALLVRLRRKPLTRSHARRSR